MSSFVVKVLTNRNLQPGTQTEQLGNRRHNILFVALASIFVATTIFVLGFSDLTGSDDVISLIQYVGLLIILAFVCLWGIRWISRLWPQDLIWLHPPVLISIYSFFYLGVTGLYTFIDPNSLGFLFLLIDVDHSMAVGGLALIIVGCLCLWTTYVPTLWFIKARSTSKFYPTITPGTTLLIYSLPVIAQIIQIQVTGIAYGADRSAWQWLEPFQQWITYIQQIAWLILSIVSLQVFAGKQHWSFLAAIVLTQGYFGLTSGFMKPVLWIGVVLFLCFLAQRIPVRQFLWLAIPILIIGLVLVPVAEDLRSQFRRGTFNSRDLISVTIATTRAIETNWLERTDVGWESFISRILLRHPSGVYMPGIVMAFTPSIIPYQGFEQLLAIPTYIIPRALWPDKPVLTRGVWFSINYLNAPTDTTSSSTPTLFGEGYLFGGWWGTILTCLILGFMLGIVYRGTVSAGMLPVFIALAPSFVDVEITFTGMAISLIQLPFVYIVVYRLMNRASDQVHSRI